MELRRSSDRILPLYSASRNSARFRVLSVNRSVSSELVRKTVTPAKKIKAISKKRTRQGLNRRADLRLTRLVPDDFTGTGVLLMGSMVVRGLAPLKPDGSCSGHRPEQTSEKPRAIA